jgi:hypothetical protein
MNFSDLFMIVKWMCWIDQKIYDVTHVFKRFSQAISPLFQFPEISNEIMQNDTQIVVRIGIFNDIIKKYRLAIKARIKLLRSAEVTTNYVQFFICKEKTSKDIHSSSVIRAWVNKLFTFQFISFSGCNRDRMMSHSSRQETRRILSTHLKLKTLVSYVLTAIDLKFIHLIYFLFFQVASSEGGLAFHENCRIFYMLRIVDF